MKPIKFCHVGAFILLLLLASVAMAEEPVSKSYFGDLAIGGHDSVVYHTQPAGQHKAQEGDSKFAVKWKGANWRFTTLADSKAFAADPEKYAPAYNGFCANALSLGKGLVKTDGSHWQIFDDQLYVFYGKGGRKRWLKGDVTQFKKDADKAWADIVASN